jgi:hypothetical protein
MRWRILQPDEAYCRCWPRHSAIECRTGAAHYSAFRLIEMKPKSLSEGLQQALWESGQVSEKPRTDSLSAVVKPVGSLSLPLWLLFSL